MIKKVKIPTLLHKKQKKIAQFIIILLSLFFITPILFTVMNSLITPNEALYRIGIKIHEFKRHTNIILLPDTLTIRQFYKILTENNVYLIMFWNSIFYSLSIIVLVNIFTIPLAFLLSKVYFKGRLFIFFIFISLMLMPSQVTLLSNYIMSANFLLLGKRISIILPSVFAPINAFILSQYMQSIPDEWIDAAEIETNSFYMLLRHIIIPEITPGLAAMNILVFSESWNMIDKPSLFLNNFIKMPLSVALNGFYNEAPEISFAASILFMLPAFFLFIIFYNQIIAGLERFKW
jgi:multiple sugar transport system permease protein